jgi:hypothetical protein
MDRSAPFCESPLLKRTTKLDKDGDARGCEGFSIQKTLKPEAAL